MRKLINFLVAFFCMATLMFTTVYAQIDIPEPTPDFYVNDFANIFSDSEKVEMIKKAKAFSDEHDGTQVVITTIKSLDGNTIEDYAYEMYNKYGIGKDDMGLLVLLSTEDRLIRVEVGKAMEAYINDSKAGRIIDKHAIPYLKQNDFKQGLKKLQDALFEEINSAIEKEKNPTRNSGFPFVVKVEEILFIIITLCLGLFFYFIHKYNKARRIEREEEKRKLEEKVSRLQSSSNRYKDEINSLRSKNNMLESQYQAELDQLKHMYTTLSSKYNEVNDYYRRAVILYPNLPSEIKDMIEEEKRKRDMEIAHNVDLTISNALNNRPNRNNVSLYSDALDEYNSLTDSQKNYIKSDINQLKELRKKAVQLKREYEGKKAEEEIISVISRTNGSASDYSQLKDAISSFNDLDSEIRRYVNSSYVKQLNDLYSRAENNKKEQERREREERERREREERERRRREEELRNSSYHSSSSGFGGFGGGSSGFGGFSGGGGATRGF